RVPAASSAAPTWRGCSPVRVLGITPRGWSILAALLAVALLAPLYLLNGFYTLQFAYVWVYAIAILGLNILTGYSGQISLGNGAFMAIGGYTTAILSWKLRIPYGVTI